MCNRYCYSLSLYSFLQLVPSLENYLEGCGGFRRWGLVLEVGTGGDLWRVPPLLCFLVCYRVRSLHHTVPAPWALPCFPCCDGLDCTLSATMSQHTHFLLYGTTRVFCHNDEKSNLIVNEKWITKYVALVYYRRHNYLWRLCHMALVNGMDPGEEEGKTIIAPFSTQPPQMTSLAASVSFP